jgi:hypothetical protein
MIDHGSVCLTITFHCCCFSPQVLEWMGQDEAFRLVKKYRGQPWPALPHAGHS